MGKGDEYWDHDRVLEYRRWDDYIKSLHSKLDDISDEMENMFYQSGVINTVCSKLLVLCSKYKAYIKDQQKIVIKLKKIYGGLHDKDYVQYIDKPLRSNPNAKLYENRKSAAINDLMLLFQEINDSLSENELNPKAKEIQDPWWKEELEDPDTPQERKTEIIALREVGII